MLKPVRMSNQKLSNHLHNYVLFSCFQYPHLPDLEGDDLRRLGQEIALARKYLQQARQYRYQNFLFFVLKNV